MLATKMPRPARVIRAVETREFRAVGGRRDVRSSFRFLPATSESLESLCDRGAFRHDLRHRFGKVVLRVPALADRREDIAPLVCHFLRLSGNSDATISARAMQWLVEHQWSGNVRALRAVVEAVAVMAPNRRVEVEDLSALAGEGPRVRALLAFDIQRTIEVLQSHAGDVYATARDLGVNPTTVYRRLRRARLAPGMVRSREERTHAS